MSEDLLIEGVPAGDTETDELFTQIDATPSSDPTLPDVNYLSVEEHYALKTWVKLQVASIIQPKTTKGTRYMAVFFKLESPDCKVRENFFNPKISAKQLVRCCGLTTAIKKSDLLGKYVWGKLGTRTGNDNEYVCIKEFAKDEPSHNPPQQQVNGTLSASQGDDLPLTNNNDGVPF